jgi:hypothetical protein
MNHWPGQLRHKGRKIVRLTCGRGYHVCNGSKKKASGMKAKSEDIGHRGSFFRFYHVLTKTKMVAINVNTVFAKVEKYKMITVGDNNPSFASYEVCM